MDKVNIYIYTTVRGPGTKSGSYTYLLEYVTEKGPATLTKQGTLEEVTENQANLQVFNEAMKRITKTCEVEIFTENKYLQQGAENWIHDWQQSGWMTARKKPVANREEWEKAAELLGRHEIRFHVKEEHSYKNWIQSETEKREKERISCLKGLENSTQQKR